MILCGLQKLSLLDYPEKLCATVFTAGCNLRCPFCHNAGLVLTQNEQSIEPDTFFSFLERRRGKLEGVCITGGEPLLQPDIKDFIKKIKELGYLVKLDTNGSNPDMLFALIKDRLVDYVAMDIKNSLQKYSLTCGIDHLDTKPFQKTVALLMGGDIAFEFRTTLVKEFHTVDDIAHICEWIKGAKNYFLQNFVDSGNIISSQPLHAVDPETVVLMQQKALEYHIIARTRG